MDIQFVQHLLATVEDTSVNSPELARSWVNGVTECHLNPDRTNILRLLALGPELNVLEIGCSSGILSRYLGEQGHQVTGIKTGPNCLAAAKLRCADMANVTFAADADEITAALEKTYDLVLLVPPLAELLETVLQGGDSREQGVSAVGEIAASLRILMSLLTENGLLVLGTGNRLGLKYWLGATEEYYGRPYAGLWGYGSREQSPWMFCRNEWLDILRQADIPHHRFLYPFPDHQFAHLMLSDDFIRTDPYAHSLLYRMRSRDVSVPDWLPDQDEFLYWKSLHQAGHLQDFANSFLLVAAKKQAVLTEVFLYDFIRLSKSQRQRKYHTLTYKEKQLPVVVKKQVEEKKAPDISDHAAVSHEPSSHTYIRGPLLAELWLDALVMSGRTGDFKKLLQEYYQFLKVTLQQAEQPGRYLDLLPFNIIFDANGHYQVFDQEWGVDCADISPEFILFRALLWFGFAHDAHLSCRLVEEKLTNIAEFIHFGFQLLSLEQQPSFIEQEGRVQHSIDPSQGVEQVRAVLYQPFQQAIRTYQSTLFKTELYWVTETTPLSANNSLTVHGQTGREQQTLFFALPDPVEQLKILRFDPADRPGLLHLHRLTLWQATADSEQGRVLWEAVGSHRIAELAILENLHYCSSALGEVFLSVGQDPQVIIELPEFVTEQSGQGRLLFEVVIDWPQSADYLVVLDEIQTQRRLLANMQETARLHLAKEQVRLQEEQRRLGELQEHMAIMRERLVALEYKLDAVRRTCVGRLLRKLKFSPFQF
ncbi:methyltransferase domain-containing protein [Candidatus Electronema sp. PJ]|uniref:methyltransferase domain-containing protein n=1 Tax=Candidatus Electronema sp. PJ TaxID=3401572 RepID=UPI003AA94F4A